MATLIPIRFSLLVSILLLSVNCLAAVIHDPWLVRFQVGEFRDLAAVELVGGWPSRVLEPVVLDPGWQLGADAFFASARFPRALDLTAWRLAVPALGTAAGVETYYQRARRQWRLLTSLADRNLPLPSRLEVGRGPWTQEIRQLWASRLWEAGAVDDAASAAADLVAEAATLGLGSDAAFVWAMRADLLAARAGLPMSPQRLWDALLELGLYDTRSGWAVWSARRRSRGEAPLPPGRADREAGVMLATAGKLWLTTEQFYALGLPDEVTAGLGAIRLPKSDLDTHFRRWPDVPEDGRFQGYWLRGRRRLDGTAAAVEKLADLPGLKDGHRLDLWRRASEKHLLARQWQPGLADLEAALALMDSDASAGVRARLREWLVQSLALAMALDRAVETQRILDLVDQYLSADQKRAFSEDASALLADLGLKVASPANEMRERAAATVRQGDAGDLQPRHGVVLPPANLWRDHLWRQWARWGLALPGGSTPNTAALRQYEQGLQAVLAAEGRAQRHSTACAVAARGLRDSDAVGPLVDWAVERDIELLAGGQCLPSASPLPDLRARAPRHDLATLWRGHALLGAALALGDDHGMISMAVRLPADGVEDELYRLFWYPVPADTAVRAALEELDVPAEILLAIARNESLFEPAVRSRAGALGYMQIMPFHYDEPAGPPGSDHWSHPGASLRAGARILAGEIRRYQGDPYRAIAAYNAGSGAVNRWDKQLGGRAERKLFWAWIGYPETRKYTLRVLRDRAVYRELLEQNP